MKFKTFALAALLAAGFAPAFGATSEGETLTTTDRLVIKYRTDARRAQAQSASGGEGVAKVNGVTLRAHIRTMASGAEVMQLPEHVTLAQARQLAAKIAQAPDVLYAEPDVRVHVQATNDKYSAQQWPLRAGGTTVGGANFEAAWALAGTRKVTIAVIDTGSVNHADLTANEVGGYDFISDVSIAGDADGRDADASDPGDYCQSTSTSSTWHGLTVAGLIGALGNNAYGVAGAAHANARILHVRALGRCGGYLSDVADGMTWAVGGTVAGVPANSNPAQVLNLSLGAAAGTSCFTYMQDAVNTALAKGAVVVAAAGNEGAATVGAPANCTGVIAVGAHTASGDLADYSNYSAMVSLTAPGGGTCRTLSVCDQAPTVTLGNSGLQGLGSNLEAAYFAGTSAATPHVSAAAALLLAANPLLTPAQVKTLLISSARPHPAGTYCRSNPTACGAGMLDAAAALGQVIAPGVTVTAPQKAVAGGTAVTLTAVVDGTASSYGFSWSQKSGPAIVLTNADKGTISFTAPATKGADIVLTVAVSSLNAPTVTRDVVVKVNNAPQLTVQDSVAVIEGASLSIPVSAIDADGDAVTFAVSGATGVQVTNGALVWSAPRRTNQSATSEVVVLTVTATDGTADGSGDASKTVTVTINAPVPSGNTGSNGSGGSSGGGGSMDWLALCALGLVGLFARRKH